MAPSVYPESEHAFVDRPEMTVVISSCPKSQSPVSLCHEDFPSAEALAEGLAA
jgi:hypothetical protein